LSEGDRARFKDAYLRDVAAQATDDGIWVDVPSIFALGTAP